MEYIKSGGMGFLGWLTILFIGLKLTGYIAWSWFWVLSPLIFVFGIIGIILIILILIVILTAIFGD